MGCALFLTPDEIANDFKLGSDMVSSIPGTPSPPKKNDRSPNKQN